MTIIDDHRRRAGGQDWRHRAACRQLPQHLFDLDHASHRYRLAPCTSCRHACSACSACPVRRECREEGLHLGDRFHVRAGGVLIRQRTGVVPARGCAGCGLPVLQPRSRVCCARCASAVGSRAS